MMKKRVLVVGDERWISEELDPILNRSVLEVFRIPGGRQAIYLSSKVDLDLLVAVPPLVDIDVPEFCSKVRAALPLSSQPQILVVGVEEQLGELDGLEDEGLFIVPLEQSQDAVRKAVGQVLGQAPRACERLKVQLHAQLKSRSLDRTTRTENISETGMLVRGSTLLPLGTKLRFELALAADGTTGTLSGEAEVVRHARSGAESVRGLGLRFLGFGEDGRERLKTYLNAVGSTLASAHRRPLLRGHS